MENFFPCAFAAQASVNSIMLCILYCSQIATISQEK
jgi:hypothetical protein